MPTYIQESIGAEPEPPIKYGFENGYIFLEQEDEIIITTQESFDKFISTLTEFNNSIKKELHQTG